MSSVQEWLEIQKEQELIRQEEIANFREANGFSDEEDEFIREEFGIDVPDYW